MMTPSYSFSSNRLSVVNKFNRYIFVRAFTIVCFALLLSLWPLVSHAQSTEETFPIDSQFMYTNSVAWGDWDGDGDLDLAVGNAKEFSGGSHYGSFRSGKNQIYRNDNGELNLVWSSPDEKYTNSVAWGDWDNDGDLDLAVGNGRIDSQFSEGEVNQIYENNNGDFIVRDFDDNKKVTTSVAWGHMDDDKFLDLAVGNIPSNWCEPDGVTQVYRNNRDIGNDILSLIWESSKDASNMSPDECNDWDSRPDGTSAVAWGKLDDDRYLDLAVGNAGIYKNEGKDQDGNWSFTLVDSRLDDDDKETRSVAWGDWDNDGDLDLAVGNGNYEGQVNQVYQNNDGVLELAWESTNDEMATSSVAWGDWDNDGFLDLAVGNVGVGFDTLGDINQIYRNDDKENSNREFVLAWKSDTDKRYTNSIAWGDWDNDGDLDLIAGNGRLNDGAGGPSYYEPPQANMLTVFNSNFNSGEIFKSAWEYSYLNPETGYADSVASISWGDWNNDDDLDLAVCTYQQIEIFENDNGKMRSAWSEDGSCNSMAWGDWNNNGYLDLAVGGGAINPTEDLSLGNENGSVRIFKNSHPDSDLKLIQTITNTHTAALAWADYDNDGDLDLAAANDGVNQIFKNVPGVGFTAVWTSTETYNSTDIAWGDWDNDGDPDLAFANFGAPNQVYENRGSVLYPVWSADSGRDTGTSVAWGDWDNDGDLDLAMGYRQESTQVFENMDNGLRLAWDSGVIRSTASVAWGDWDNDGDLDLAVGNMNFGADNEGESNQVYENNEGQLKLAWEDGFNESTNELAWGDWDNDGDLDLVVANTFPGNWPGTERGVQIYENKRAYLRLANNPPYAKIHRPGETGDGAPYSVANIIDSNEISITFTLFEREGDTVPRIEAFYSLNGSGKWLPAFPAENKPLTELSTNPQGEEYVFVWDTFASGFFGQSDNVVFRIDVHGDGGAGPFLQGKTSAFSPSFRVRGTQVRVVNDDGDGISDAIVYRLDQNQTKGALPISTDGDRAFQTDPEGYLKGRGALGEGEHLVALQPVALPITLTDKLSDTVRLYYTSAPVTAIGLDMNKIDAGGVQTLTVSSKRPLLIFDLDISLEWDARSDAAFQQRLSDDLERASELLFDWTNGQAALGEINIYHERQNWDEADIRILASNRQRPNADLGGVVTTQITDTVNIVRAGESITDTVSYLSGRVRMPVLWNRFGDAGEGFLGEDWSRTLSHELGHYLFFLQDNYLGLDEENNFISVSDCPGVMSDPYRDDDRLGYDEFNSQVNWPYATEKADCRNSLSERILGRSDWATIQHHYSMIISPTMAITATNYFSGPNSLPLALTQVEYTTTITATNNVTWLNALPLSAPFFSLIDAKENNAYVPTSQGRAFLFAPDERRLVDLGNPVGDQIKAWGAKLGDLLCVFDQSAGRNGCVEVKPGLSEVRLQPTGDWYPDVILSPESDDRIAVVVVTGLTITPSIDAPEPLMATLYPIDSDRAAITTTLKYNGDNDVYEGYFDLDDEAVLEAYVHIWTGEQQANSPHQVVTDYAIGGSPAGDRGNQGRAKGVQRSYYPGCSRRGRVCAPVLSSDGQALLFGDKFEPEEGQFYALQTATGLPAPPDWVTPVGQAYRLLLSKDQPSLAGAGISLSYQGGDVPPGEENGLRMYYYDENKGQWIKLEGSAPDSNYNFVVGQVEETGEGLYMLMSSMEIPLEEGWNLVGYPLQASQPITAALASITGTYSILYAYDKGDSEEPWRVADPVDQLMGGSKGNPPPVDQINSLDFGRGYLIYVTEPDPVTLILTGGTPYPLPKKDDIDRPSSVESLLSAGVSFGEPPAAFYVEIPSSEVVPPNPVLRAFVDDQLCGSATLQSAKEGEPYGGTILVSARNAQQPGCGAVGSLVEFRLQHESDKVMATGVWDNRWIQRIGPELE